MLIAATCLPHPTDADTWLLFLELGVEASTESARNPVHVVLALDASSSMGGPRLACAIEAARALVARLGPEDQFGLLAFDRGVRVLFGPGKVNEAARALLHDALASLRPGLGTALHAGLLRSHDMLRRVFVREARPRAIILTDGYPSVGPREPEAFEAIARTAAAEGIVTSAVGVGVDYDEQSVSAIATGGGGRYSFVAQEADIPGALALHLADLFAVGLDNATVRVLPSTAVTEATLLHRYPTRVGPEGFTVETGPIGRDCPRRLLFSLRVACDPAPTAATVAVSARGAAEEQDRIIAVPVERTGPAVQEGLREYHRLTLSAREADFWAAVHAGDAEAARAGLVAAEVALAGLAGAGARESETSAHRRRLLDGRAVLEGRLNAEAREAARKRAHQSQVLHVTSFFTPEE